MLELLGVSFFLYHIAHRQGLLCVPVFEVFSCFNVSSSARIVSSLDSSPVRKEPHLDGFEPAGAAIAIQS